MAACGCDMFGLLISGRLVQTNFVQVDETKVVINVADADNVNHIVIFMTGTLPFPDGYGGAVYFSWPSAAGPAWYFLGLLTNDKPSAIFKVAGLKRDEPTDACHPFGQLSDHQSHMMQIGISVETLGTLSQLTPAVEQAVQTVDSYRQFCIQMVQNCFNFLASFSVTKFQLANSSTVCQDEYVPLSQLKSWYESFERRLTQNPNFWKSY